jgi:hypothetical protein
MAHSRPRAGPRADFRSASPVGRVEAGFLQCPLARHRPIGWVAVTRIRKRSPVQVLVCGMSSSRRGPPQGVLGAPAQARKRVPVQGPVFRISSSQRRLGPPAGTGRQIPYSARPGRPARSLSQVISELLSGPAFSPSSLSPSRLGSRGAPRGQAPQSTLRTFKERCSGRARAICP